MSRETEQTFEKSFLETQQSSGSDSTDKPPIDWSKFGSKSDASIPISEAPYTIDLPSIKMPPATVGTPTEYFGPPINAKLKMPPAAGGAIVHFTLVRDGQKDEMKSTTLAVQLWSASLR